MLDYASSSALRTLCKCLIEKTENQENESSSVRLPTIKTLVDGLVVRIGSRVELAGRLKEKNRV